MSSHIVYHPRRSEAQFGSTTVFFDRPRGNQDPYLWSTRFLHTFCHMTELRAPGKGDVNFWVSGDSFPQFRRLYCDLVFVVDEVHLWSAANHIASSDSLVDSSEAYADHYLWASYQHRFRTRKRKTLKAHPRKSFQPQDSSGGLIDIVPMLKALGWGLGELRQSLRKGRSSKPRPLSDQAAGALYQALYEVASTKLTGTQLRTIRLRSPQLASPAPEGQ